VLVQGLNITFYLFTSMTATENYNSNCNVLTRLSYAIDCIT